MPNWCENDLAVEGPKEVIEEFLKFAAGESPFDFEKFIPYPEKFQRRMKSQRLGTRSMRNDLTTIGAQAEGRLQLGRL